MPVLMVGGMIGLPRCPTVSLPGLADLVLTLELESPRLIAVGDFNIHADAGEDKPAQDCLDNLRPVANGNWTHPSGRDLLFCSDQADLRVGERPKPRVLWLLRDS